MSRPVSGNPAIDTEVKNALTAFRNTLFKGNAVRRDKLRNLDLQPLRDIQLTVGTNL